MSNHSLFIPISKVDAKQRLVYGRLSEEVADKSGEILDYASSKPAFQKWSDDQFEASGGKSRGNLRAMHDNIAAGKFTDISFDDASKSIEGVAKVIDDDSWNKVLEGVFTGFSIGGGYAKRWTDPDQPHLKRYTPTLAEVSLVDNPCVPTATFEFIKEDGSTELRKFNATHEVPMTKTKKAEPAAAETNAEADAAALIKSATEAEAAGTATEEQKALLAKATGEAEETTETPVTEEPAAVDTAVEKAERPQDKGGVVQGFQAKDGSFHMKKADALKRNETLEVEAISQPALDALKNLADALTKAESGIKKDEAAEGETEKKPDGEVAKAATDVEPEKEAAEKAAAAEEVKKGMYTVSNFADLLQSILYLQQDTQWEAEWEGDNSELPANLKAWLAEGGALLVQMVTEETAELTASKAAVGELAKKGAKISAATKEQIAAMHKSATDHMGVMDKCVKEIGMGDDAEKSDKGDLEKATKAADDTVIVERDALKKTLGDMVPQINALVKRVTELESQPMPSKGALRVVTKGEDSGHVSDGDAKKKAEELLKSMTPEEQSMVLMKAALSLPKPIMRNQ